MTLLTEELLVRTLTDAQFEHIRKVVYDTCGINLHEGKKQLVHARLNKRLRALGLPGFREYIGYVENDPTGREFSQMIDALTTNKTEFFREPQHFELLKREIIPSIKTGQVRIWSAGCSSGEEPYSIAIMFAEYLRSEGKDVRILATDLSSAVLQKARKAVYPRETVAPLSPVLKERYFSPVRGVPGTVRPVPTIRSMVRFARLNLMDEWPMRGPFDLVFCRNVMIYFDKPTQQRLVSRYYEILRPGGYMFVGHSESLAGLKHEFTYIQPAVYRK